MSLFFLEVRMQVEPFQILIDINSTYLYTLKCQNIEVPIGIESYPTNITNLISVPNRIDVHVPTGQTL